MKGSIAQRPSGADDTNRSLRLTVLIVSPGNTTWRHFAIRADNDKLSYQWFLISLSKLVWRFIDDITQVNVTVTVFTGAAARNKRGFLLVDVWLEQGEEMIAENRINHAWSCTATDSTECTLPLNPSLKLISRYLQGSASQSNAIISRCYYLSWNIQTLICLWISICLGRKWAYLNLSCQGVVKEIRIKKHDQNANLCLIVATDSVWPFTDFTSRHNHDTTLTDILNITNVIFMPVNVIELYYISLNWY